MKVLWLCNTVPSEVCDIFSFRKTYYEGWLSGMLNELKMFDDIELSICIPIRNPERMKDGEAHDYKYYSYYSMGIENSTEKQIERFCEIIREAEPDVVHIWGSEYGATLSMVKSSKIMGIGAKVVVHIQGLASAIVAYSSVSIPDEWVHHVGENGRTIREDNELMMKRGQRELATLASVEYVLGRTEWDKSYVKSINGVIKYRYCGEILREQFYQTNYSWNVDKCRRHSIFITQGGYAIKGVHLIIPAIAILKKKYSDIKVYVSGNSPLSSISSGIIDPYSEYLKVLMKDYEVEEAFEFTGPLEPEQMIERYMNANILAVTSTIENSSNSIGEAQFLGVPVVASYTGGTPSLVEHGKTGMMYQMDAPYMFAACVKRIFDDDDFAIELSRNEQKIAKKRYDPQIVSTQLYEIYKEMVNI